MDIGKLGMRKIKPYYEFIQTELIDYIKSAPDHWQAKVLACLSFSEIYSFNEVKTKTNLSPIYVMKALIISEEFDVTSYFNEGWIMNKKLDAEKLNNYLQIDIAEYDIDNDPRIRRLIHDLPHYIEMSNTDNPNLAEKNSSQSLLEGLKETTKHSENHKTDMSSSLYIANTSELNLERSIEGSGRKKSEEWNSSIAIEYNREIRNAIAKKNIESNNIEKENKVVNKARKTPTKEEEKAERVYIKLCTNHPEYEKYITRCHKNDPSLKQMEIVAEKIRNDYLEEERRKLDSEDEQ